MMDPQRVLATIVNKANNRTCADCSTKNPRWVSISLGVFVCIRCCGVHRNLGTHISKMKSVTLDKWQPDWIRIFDSLDNEIANRYWERTLPAGFHKPSDSSTTFEVESFIRDKYEFKRWVPDGEPDPISAVLAGKTSTKTEKKPEKKQEEKVWEVQPQRTVDLLAVEPIHVQSPKPEFVLDWSAPPMEYPASPKPVQQSPAQVHLTQSVPVQAAPVQAAPIFQSNVGPGSAGGQSAQARENNIKNIMSMYGSQPQASPSAQQATFKPLGAIAAEQMFRGNPSQARSGYPTYAQQWPSF